MDELIAKAQAGNRRAIARLITRVENDEEAAKTAVTTLYSQTGQSHIVGITGSPGSGKSTLVNALAKELRRRDLQVGIVAVDPSSPFTGGALLGDRVRMQDLAGDKGIFIRSLASRGSLGGLSRATSAVVKVLAGSGFDVVLVETVGAGQAEVDIANTAHTTLVIEAPGMGDDIQSIKAGILEIADILVVNKGDRPGSNRTVRSLQTMLHLNPEGGTMRHHGRVMQMAKNDDPAYELPEDGWQVPVQRTVATEGDGLPELVDAIQSHWRYLQESGEWLEREKERSRQEIEHLLKARFMSHLQKAVAASEQEAMVTAVAERELDPYTAVDQLFARATLPEVMD
ncbi:MAG TPA: methylmalonyl Co-A mutase-associated GTPase MeaB [Anaerolineae bacterium]|nr:methylmalonyl Co-A mutase-associated GTPase MeaB [Anaerolineae bacterium]